MLPIYSKTDFDISQRGYIYGFTTRLYRSVTEELFFDGVATLQVYCQILKSEKGVTEGKGTINSMGGHKLASLKMTHLQSGWKNN